MALALVACGAGPHASGARPQPDATPAPKPDPAMAEVLATLRLHRDQMCACADAACAEKAEAEHFEWGFAHKELVDHVKPTPAQQKEASTLIEAAEECAHAVR